MATFSGFSRSNQLQLQGDIPRAKQLAMRCNNVLLVDQRGQIAPEISALLQDTFGIDGSDLDQVSEIRNRYLSFGGRIDTVAFTFTRANSSSPTNMGHDAYVEFRFGVFRVNEIFVTPTYFRKVDPDERARILIHEHIHLVNNAPGHPPGDSKFAFFQRDRMGLDFGDAVLNPYCYEYFAAWLP